MAMDLNGKGAFDFSSSFSFKRNLREYLKPLCVILLFEFEPAAEHCSDRNRPSTPGPIISDGSATQDGHFFIQKIIQKLMTPCPPRFNDSRPK